MNIQTISLIISDRLRVTTGNIYLGLFIALISGIAIASIDALLVITLAANQVATGFLNSDS
ncbi:MAG: hypothetical protein V7L05_29130 [Nostoc sp.]|uniref:hypothetical protein n=1 Tax=Nostoc sp. TaxID=1180 RepID=UPI002FFC616D